MGGNGVNKIIFFDKVGFYGRFRCGHVRDVKVEI